MVTTQLTPDLVREGEALVKKLQASGLSPSGAFWFYYPDKQRWKLFLVDKKVATDGPREIYLSVQKALRALRSEVVYLTLQDVTTAPPDMPLAAILSRVISSQPGIGGFRLSRSVIKGEMIDDAYIYRVKRPAA
jgi:hypothetical protein